MSSSSTAGQFILFWWKPTGIFSGISNIEPYWSQCCQCTKIPVQLLQIHRSVITCITYSVSILFLQKFSLKIRTETLFSTRSCPKIGKYTEDSLGNSDSDSIIAPLELGGHIMCRADVVYVHRSISSKNRRDASATSRWISAGMVLVA
jgi:hypothetical protein